MATYHPREVTVDPSTPLPWVLRAIEVFCEPHVRTLAAFAYSRTSGPIRETGRYVDRSCTHEGHCSTCEYGKSPELDRELSWLLRLPGGALRGSSVQLDNTPAERIFSDHRGR